MTTVEKPRVKCVASRYVEDRILRRLAGPEDEGPLGGAGRLLEVSSDVKIDVKMEAHGNLGLDERSKGAPEAWKTKLIWRGPPARAAAPPDPATCPFDLEVPPPYAVDLLRLCEINGAKVPPEIRAKLGPNTAVLICHRLTPFAQEGERPHGIWSMGYTAKLSGQPAATTIGLVPDTKLTSVAAAEAKVDVGVGAGGEFGLLEGTAAAAGTATGGLVRDVKLSLSADAKFAFILSLDLDVSLLEIHAGPVGAGGARWDLYRRGKRIDVRQSLAHTVVVPKGTASLKLVVETWIRESNWLGGPATQWTFAPQRFTVSLEGQE